MNFIFIEQSFQAELDSEAPSYRSVSPFKSVTNTVVSSTETSYASALETQEPENQETGHELVSKQEIITNNQSETRNKQEVTDQKEEEETVGSLVR